MSRIFSLVSQLVISTDDEVSGLDRFFGSLIEDVVGHSGHEAPFAAVNPLLP